MRFLWIGFLLAAAFLGAQEEESSAWSPEAGLKVDFLGALGLESRWDTALAAPSAVLEAQERFTSGRMEFSLKHRLEMGLQPGQTPQGTIYEAYGLYRPWDGGDFYLGKRRLPLGLGSTFTPGDTFNPWAGAWDQKSGTLGFQGVFSFGQDFGLSGAVSAVRAYASGDLKPENLDYALGFNGLWDRLQVQGSLVYGWGRSFNPGLGFSYDLGGWILSGEGAVEFLPRNLYPRSGLAYTVSDDWTDPRFSGILGARYTWTGEELMVTVSQEYFFFGQGWTEDQLDRWNSLSLPLPTPRPFRAQHYSILKLSLGWDQGANLGLTVQGNLVENSWLTQISTGWTFEQNLELAGAFLMARGPEKSEWEWIPQRPGLAQQFTLNLKVHF